MTVLHCFSIHALLAESDLSLFTGLLVALFFYPRSPCGERLCDNTYTLGITDFSIHALLAESDAKRFSTLHNILFSIHALLAESDSKSAQNSGALLRI